MDYKQIVKTIESGFPVALLLGESIWKRDLGYDPVLKRCQEHLKSEEIKNYQKLLEHGIDDNFYDWLSTVYYDQPTPAWLETLSSFPWSFIYTSSFDPSLLNKFKNPNRSANAIIPSTRSHESLRRKDSINIHYLLGKAGEEDKKNSPPCNQKELLRSKGTWTQSEFQALGQLLTPLGKLVIEGISTDEDLINLQDLVIFQNFHKKQIYWFSFPAELENNPIIQILKDDEILTTSILPFQVAIEELKQSGELPSFIIEERRAANYITLSNSRVKISPKIRLKTSSSVALLDDTFFEHSDNISIEKEKSLFERFHGAESSASRLIEGIQKNFSIARDIEEELYQRILKSLDEAGRRHSAIIIEGQSASGKSILLARLANRFKLEKKYPVIFSPHATRLPTTEELHDFCLTCENAGAEAVLLICDANAKQEEYDQLAKQFKSIGRKTIIVGSTYSLGEAKSTIKVPAKLSEKEHCAIKDLFLHHIGNSLEVHNDEEDGYLLAMLYYNIVDSRPIRSQALIEEAKVNISELKQIKNIAPKDEPYRPLAIELAKLDLFQSPETSETSETKTESEPNIFAFVAVAMLLQCPVPSGLLFRAIGKDIGYSKKVFNKLNIFRWVKEDDEFFISTRLNLEAEIFCKLLVGGTDREASILIELASNANLGSLFSNPERRFIIQLAKNFGPNGPQNHKYIESYYQFASTLTTMRKSTSPDDSGVMLQEAALRREYVKFLQKEIKNGNDKNPRDTNKKIDAILEEALEIVNSAIDLTQNPSSQWGKRQRASLLVERASIFGYLAGQEVRVNPDSSSVVSFYSSAMDAISLALVESEDIRAIDIALWNAIDIIENRTIKDDGFNLKIIADVHNILSLVNENDLSKSQRHWIIERKKNLYNLLGDTQNIQKALTTLKDEGSPAYYYLKSLEMGADVFINSVSIESKKTEISNAISYLKDNTENIIGDFRCLYLYVQLLWANSTSMKLHTKEERKPIPQRIDQHVILDYVNILVADSKLGQNFFLRYIRAILLWVTGDYSSAKEAWYDLNRDSKYINSNRLIRQFLWTDDELKPKIFTGRLEISPAQRNSRGQVFVEEIQRKVPINADDINAYGLKEGLTIPDGFKIAFNFAGPIIDFSQLKAV